MVESDEYAIGFLALSSKPIPVGSPPGPKKVGASEVCHPVSVVIEPVGPSKQGCEAVVGACALMPPRSPERDGVVVYPRIGDDKRAISTAPAVLLDQRDTVTARGINLDGVVVDLHVGRSGHYNLRTPEPGVVSLAVSADRIVADHSSIADLVKDADTAIVFNDIAVIQHVDVIAIGPKPRSTVVMDMVAPQHQTLSGEKLRASRFPARLEAVLIVVTGNLVILNDHVPHNPLVLAAEANLAIHEDAISANGHLVADGNTCSMVEADDVVFNQPALAYGAASAVFAVDGAVLRRVGVFFDCQTSNGYVRGGPIESKGGHGSFDKPAGRIVAHVEAIAGVIHVPAARPNRAKAGDMP